MIACVISVTAALPPVAGIRVSMTHDFVYVLSRMAFTVALIQLEATIN